MALNKYMHPRNKYKTPPDFNKLAKQYPEFLNIVKKDVKEKASINFKDPHSLRILTKCLLQSDFNLKVEIPEDRLVPTLPLRLNYILWLEDLMNALGKTTVNGIDIGTGACAIYPLLGAVKNKWFMVGTETDEFSFEIAQRNVLENNLDHLIEIKKSSSCTLLQHFFPNEYDKSYDFCMCNPPFYSSVQELFESRSPARPPPKNGFTGSPQELITNGGELEFIRRLIAESKNLKNNVLIFTSMVGHKYNLKLLLEDLKSDHITHSYTEFCQGRITRWGLAWTFQNYDLKTMVPMREQNEKKANPPKVYVLPPVPNIPYDLENTNRKITTIFNELGISNKITNKWGSSITIDVVAQTNTWCNQRRKRRLMKRLEKVEYKKLKLSSDTNQTEESNSCKEETVNTTNMNNNKTTFKQDTDNNERLQTTSAQSECVSEDRTLDSVDKQVQEGGSIVEPLLHALFKLVTKGNEFVLVADFLNGTGGKQSLHEICQYIQNNWK